MIAERCARSTHLGPRWCPDGWWATRLGRQHTRNRVSTTHLGRSSRRFPCSRLNLEDWASLSPSMPASSHKLRAAGQLVSRKEEDVNETYPSLVSAVRAPATRASENHQCPSTSRSSRASTSRHGRTLSGICRPRVHGDTPPSPAPINFARETGVRTVVRFGARLRSASARSARFTTRCARCSLLRATFTCVETSTMACASRRRPVAAVAS